VNDAIYVQPTDIFPLTKYQTGDPLDKIFDFAGGEYKQ